MCVLMARSRVKMERESEVEAAIEKAFLAIAEAQPEGVRYAREMNEIRGDHIDQESKSVDRRAAASMTS